MQVISAQGPGDPRLADFQEVRDKDLLRAGVFLVEGDVPVLHFLERSPMQARSVLLSERRVGPLRQRLAGCVGDTPVYVLPQAQMEEVVGFRIHRGVLASGDRPPGAAPDEVLGDAQLVLALEGLTNHDNVGACFRTCDPLYRKAIRVSAGAALTVPWAVGEDGPELVAACRRAGLRVVALTPAREAPGLRQVLTGGPAALLVGTEGPGLTAASLEAADCLARIPMQTGFDSLNVATAAAVALAFHRDRRPSP